MTSHRAIPPPPPPTDEIPDTEPSPGGAVEWRSEAVTRTDCPHPHPASVKWEDKLSWRCVGCCESPRDLADAQHWSKCALLGTSAMLLCPRCLPPGG